MNNRLFSRAMVLEDLKRFKGISFAAFIYYILCGPFIMMNQSSGYSCAGVVKGFNFGYAFGSVALPVIASAAVFGYLYKVSSVSTIHAQPYTRKSLYGSNVLAGALISIVPVILTFVTFVVLRQCQSFTVITDDINTKIQTVRLAYYLSMKDVLKWLLINTVSILFTYAVSCFAALTAGNGVIHVLTSLGMNFVSIVVCVLMELFAAEHLYGFYDVDLDWVPRLHPVFAFGNRASDEPDAPIPWKELILYSAIAAVVLILGYYLYKHRRHENTGDSYVFEPVSCIIGLLLVFCGSSSCGMAFGNGYSAYLIGGLVCLIISQMIIQKTVRIFNRKTLTAFVLAAVMMAVTVAGFELDPLGFEKRVPDPEKVSSVRIEANLNSYFAAICSKTPEDILRAEELHRELLAGKYIDDSYPSFCADIYYELKDGTVMKRRYYTSGGTAEGKALEQFALEADYSELLEHIASLDLTDQWYNCSYYDETGECFSSDQFILSPQDMKALLKCAAEEYIAKEALFYSNQVLGRECGHIDIQLTHPKEMYEQLKKYCDANRMNVYYSVSITNSWHDFEETEQAPAQCSEDIGLTVYGYMHKTAELLETLVRDALSCTDEDTSALY